MITTAIALGGNVGNVHEVFAQALAKLDAVAEIILVSRSRNFRTKPMGENAGAPYVNAVALLQTSFSPQALLKELQRVESEFGRKRDTHWGSRTLDLDLLSYGHACIHLTDLEDVNPGIAPYPTGHRPLGFNEGMLTIPHPACWNRRFVLDPWCDVAPNWRHPVLGETVREMQERIAVRPLVVDLPSITPELAELLVAELSLMGIENDVAFRLGEDKVADQAIANAVVGITKIDAKATREFDPDREAKPAMTFVFAQSEAGAVDDAAELPSRVVVLPDSAEGISLAANILKAALDQPSACCD
ncbi:2-amino-4-hydroxy-6-hydroxymethyldihydropteridine diphosphokinase [Planctomicrobium sp. SH527]|uniref:2-amino-4-hydroxy-6- hydroxymethyldihydropteridine diphosphokinase n=1 Tax=Planctomicrobium sp. SH527 TaxID=3448123 RepID=UPI003F5B9337